MFSRRYHPMLLCWLNKIKYLQRNYQLYQLNWKRPIGIMVKSYGWASTKESICQEACSKSNGSSSERAPKVVATKGPPSTPSATTPTSAPASTTTMMATTKRPERHRAPLDPCQDVRECFDLQRVGGICVLVELINWSHDWRRRVDLKAEEPLQCQVKTCVEKDDRPRLERASSFFEGHKVSTEDWLRLSFKMFDPLWQRVNWEQGEGNVRW